MENINSEQRTDRNKYVCLTLSMDNPLHMATLEAMEKIPRGKRTKYICNQIAGQQCNENGGTYMEKHDMETVTIGIDHGNAAVKTRSFRFPSGVVEYEHEPYTKKDVLEYEGRFYVCGTGRQPYLRDKTVNQRYYLLTLAAIARELEQRGISSPVDVRIAAGLPLSSYGRDKKKFRKYLLSGPDPVRFKYEGRQYEIHIRDAFLYPQAYAAIFMHTELFENEPSVIVADIGGWTVDVMRLDTGAPDAESCRSLELGMIRCMDEIAEQVRRSVGLSVTPAQIETVLRGKPCTLDGKAKMVIEREGEAYAARLIAAITESGFDPGAMPIIFMGGGAGLTKGRVAPRFALSRPIVLNDISLNAKGYEQLCGAVPGDLKH